MLFQYFLLLIAAANFSFARLPDRQVHKRPGSQKRSPAVANHGMFKGDTNKPSSEQWRNNPLRRRQSSGGSPSCGSTSQLTIAAPKSNIFLGLTTDEAVAVTQFLHDNLNLTAASNATP